jgi:hypothetical protein
MKKLFCMLAVALASVSGSAGAATLTASSATGIDVGGVLYNVDFVDGTCANFFTGCNEASDFAFSNKDDALAASDALLALIDANPSFDNSGASLDGCSQNCFTYTYFYDTFSGSSPIISASVVENYCEGVFCSADKVSFFDDLDPVYNTTTENGANIAVWSQVSPVPVPASLPLLLAGMAGLGWIGRKRANAPRSPLPSGRECLPA